MAQLTIDIAQGLQDMLKNLEGNIEKTCERAVKKAEPVVVQAMKTECSKHNIAETDETRGQMVDSIKATGPKHNEKGCYDYVRPTGRDSRRDAANPSGMRNMEKLAYLEYGTAKQAATPVCRRVTNEVGPKISEVMKEELMQEVKK